MKKSIQVLSFAMLLALSACQHQEQVKKNTKSEEPIKSHNIKENRKFRQVERRYNKALADHDDAFFVLTSSEENQDNVLKKVILKKNKEWDKNHLSAERWIGTGLNEYKSLPFVTYHSNLKRHVKKLKGGKAVLQRLRSLDPEVVEPLLQNVIDVTPKLESLLELTESHDRYLQEKDKYESVVTTQLYRRS